MKIRMDYVLLLFIISSQRKIIKKEKFGKYIFSRLSQNKMKMKIAVSVDYMSTACLSSLLFPLRQNGQK